MLTRTLALAIALVVALAPAAAGQPPQRPGAPPDAQARPQAAGQFETASAAADEPSETRHVLRLDGRDIAYTATAGTVPIRLDDGKVAARMFFGEPPADAKPISFSWPLGLTLAITALATIFFGVYPTPILDFIQNAIGSFAGF